MRKLKKALSLTLVLALTLTMAVPAFAVEGDDASYSLVDTTPGTITVNFDSAGGSPVASRTCSLVKAYDAPPTPTREGYDFQGWYSAPDGGGYKVTERNAVKYSFSTL